MHQTDVQEELSEVGFVVFRHMFSREEISTLRQAILQRVGVLRGGQPNGFGRVETLAAFTMPEAMDILSDPRIVRAASQLLGTDIPTFTLHCDAHRNVLSDWHKDSGEGVREGGYFGTDVFGSQPCAVVKFGIYCEDHVNDGAGLHVRPRSHRSDAIEWGSSQAIDTEIGDVIAFDVRLSHLGEEKKGWQRRTERVASRFPGMSRGIVPPIRKLELEMSRRSDRVSLFFSYGTDDELTRRFAATNLERAAKLAGSMPTLPQALVDTVTHSGAALASI